ncbi:MAG: cation transporter [Clostridiales bacterium]|nr:MAG: cation transporter [Clostridiales bacterium]
MEKLKFNVYGMSCSACAARVDKVVRELDGVKRRRREPSHKSDGRRL